MNFRTISSANTYTGLNFHITSLHQYKTEKEKNMELKVLAIHTYHFLLVTFDGVDETLKTFCMKFTGEMLAV